MFNFKSIATTTIVLSSFLIQQSASAYPRASEKSEISFLKSIAISDSDLVQSFSLAYIERYVEENYKNKSDHFQRSLISGYKLCDTINESNQLGISGQEALLKSMISKSENGETVMTKIKAYNNVKDNLCPKLY